MNSFLRFKLTEATTSIHLLLICLLLCGVALAAETSEQSVGRLSAFHNLNTSRGLPMDQDGPVSVTYGGVFQRGELEIEPLGLAGLPSLPAGYSALSNKAYRITTTA